MPHKKFFIPLFPRSDGFPTASVLKNAALFPDSKTEVH